MHFLLTTYTASEPVTVYALNQRQWYADATSVLPETALGTDYYQISYTPTSSTLINPVGDAYAVVVTQNNTQLFHEGTLMGTLDRGQVYYHTSTADMTGVHITADKPVAFFAMNRNVIIPISFGALDHLFAQLAPVRNWGRNFFVPVSHFVHDRVRIVASQNGTNITQTGGTVESVAGGQTTLTHLNAGEWVELEIATDSNGCFIQTNYPVGVCTYLTGCGYNRFNSGIYESDPSQTWVPAIEQTFGSAVITPLIPDGDTEINAHYAIIITPTPTKSATVVSMGGMADAPLSGGQWRDNAAAGMSYYIMPLADSAMTYRYTNQAGLLAMCYGTGTPKSYHYTAPCAMPSLCTEFYINDTLYSELGADTLCSPLAFRAEIEGEMSSSAGHLKWYINEVEEVAARDRLTWSKTLPTGTYHIAMVALSANQQTFRKEAGITVKVCNTGIHTPNVFTPNGDSFFPLLDNPDKVKEYNFYVYNLFGQLLFHTTQINEGWTGAGFPAGVYIWLLEYKLDGSSSLKRTKGKVMVGR